MSPRIRIGISSCLLGEAVRYDGMHKFDSYIVRMLGRYFDFEPVCPEVGIGLGVPRMPIHLIGRPGNARAVGRDDPRTDVTQTLARYGRRMGRELDDVSGYIFKSRSPSCGLQRVPVHASGRTRSGRGIYAEALLSTQPWLPATDETQLSDPLLRDNFLERVFAYRRWQESVATGLNAAGLADFHAAHTLALMAHRPRAVSELGGLVALAERGRTGALAQEYLVIFFSTLTRPATKARHMAVLQRILDHLHRKLGRSESAALRNAIRDFSADKLPRARVLTMFRRHFRGLADPAIVRQTYLYPDTIEQRLRRI